MYFFSVFNKIYHKLHLYATHCSIYERPGAQKASQPEQAGPSSGIYKYRLFQADCTDRRHTRTRHAHNPRAMPEVGQVILHRFTRKAVLETYQSIILLLFLLVLEFQGFETVEGRHTQ